MSRIAGHLLVNRVAMTADVEAVANINSMPTVGMTLSWTGVDSPTGAHRFFVASVHDPARPAETVWVEITSTLTLSNPAGSAGSMQLTLSPIGHAWLKYMYDRTSGGTGDTLTVGIAAKQ